MPTAIEELLVVLKADSHGYESAMQSGVRLLTDMDTSAAKTAARLEQVSKAWAQPQGATEFAQNEMALREAVAAHSEQIEKQALRDKLARMEVESSAEYDNAEQRRQEEAERISASQNDLATFHSWRVAERQRELQEQQALEQHLYALTHSSYETQLNELQIWHDRQMIIYKDSAKNRELVEQIFFQRWRDLEEQNSVQMQRKLFARRAPMMLAMRQLVPSVGFLAGGQVGTLAMMMTQGFGIGAALSATMVLAQTIRRLVSDHKEIAEIVKKYREEVDKSSQSWRDAAQAVLPTTSLGRDLTAASKQQRDRIQSMMASYREEVRPNWFQRNIFGEQESRSEKSGILYGQIKAEQEMANAMDKFRAEEALTQSAREAQDIHARDRSFEISAMKEGRAKRYAQTEAEISQRRLQVLRSAEDRMQTFERDSELARIRARQAGPLELNRFEQEYQRNRIKLMKSANEERAGLQREEASRWADTDKREGDILFSRQQAVEESRIRLRSEGFARELALLHLKNAAELRSVDTNSAEYGLIQERQRNEEAQLQNDNAKQIDDIMEQQHNREQLALHKTTQLQIDREALVKNLMEQRGMSHADATKKAKDFAASQQKVIDAPLVDQAESLTIEWKRVTGWITEAEAKLKQFQLAHRDATPGEVERTAWAQERLDVANWIEEQRKLFDPVAARNKELDDYKEKLKAAVKLGAYAGGMTEEEAAKALEIKKASLFGGQDGGAYQSIRTMFVDVKGMTKKNRQEELLEVIAKYTGVLADRARKELGLLN